MRKWIKSTSRKSRVIIIKKANFQLKKKRKKPTDIKIKCGKKGGEMWHTKRV